VTLRLEPRRLVCLQPAQPGYGRFNYYCVMGNSTHGQMAVMPANLIIFGGLPGVGKTTIARELARQLAATHVRVDSIEQALRDSGTLTQPLDAAGYRVAYAIAEDNLRLGRTVIADSVNPIHLSRDAWIGVAHRAQVGTFEVEVICSDPQQHRQRLETRPADITGLRLLTWEEVVSREYEPWERQHLIIDTTRRSVAECVKELREALAK
jgi:predicted kinase